MSLQDDFAAAAQEYAARLDRQAERDRLEDLIRETGYQDNATAFAEAFEQALSNPDD